MFSTCWYTLGTNTFSTCCNNPKKILSTKDDPLLKSCLLSAGLEFLICRASFMVTSKSFLAVSITLKELDEYFDWQVGQEDKWSPTVKEDRIEAMFSIPYIGLPSVIFGRKVRESFRKLYGIDIKVIYTSFKVKNYFSLKCHTPLPLLAKVVYKFQCLHDVDKVYIGKTRRHLATRVKEHGHSTSSSAIRDHLSSCPTCQSEYSSSSFRVIDTARNDFEVTIKEALHIKNSKPALNRQLFNSGSSFVLNIF